MQAALQEGILIICCKLEVVKDEEDSNEEENSDEGGFGGGFMMHSRTNERSVSIKQHAGRRHSKLEVEEEKVEDKGNYPVKFIQNTAEIEAVLQIVPNGFYV